MAKFRRGVNCVTPEFYAELKPKLNRPPDDKKVMREYKIGQTTAQAIRNTKSYEDYRARVKKNHTSNKDKREDKEIDRIINDLNRDKKPVAVGVVHVKVEDNEGDEPEDSEETSPVAIFVGGLLIICFCLVIVGITYAVLKWAFGF